MTGRIASRLPSGAVLGLVRSRTTAKVATISSIGVPRRKRKSSPHRSCMSSMGSNRTWGREPQCGGSPCGSQITASATARAASAKRRRKRRVVIWVWMLAWRRWRLVSFASRLANASSTSGWAMARRWHADPKAHRWAWNTPGVGPGLCWWFCVEPPAGIEPATPSLPWIGGQAPCYPPSPQVVRHRECPSYVLSADRT
jgi:hypothetical protein